MVDVIRTQDFETQSFYNGPGSLRDYRLRHLPTGMQWDGPGRPGLTTLKKMRQLFAAANRDLIALGWKPGKDWENRIAEIGDSHST
jgi:hypothetical protein